MVEKCKDHKGSILLISMMFMFVLLVVVGTFVESVYYDIKLNRTQYDEDQALYIAEAGINKAIYYLRNTAPDGSTDGSWSTTAYPGGTVNNGSDCSGSNPCQELLYLYINNQYGFGPYDYLILGGCTIIGKYTIWVSQNQVCGLGACILITSKGQFDNLTKTVAVYATSPGIYARRIYHEWTQE